MSRLGLARSRRGGCAGHRLRSPTNGRVPDEWGCGAIRATAEGANDVLAHAWQARQEDMLELLE